MHHAALWLVLLGKSLSTGSEYSGKNIWAPSGRLMQHEHVARALDQSDLCVGVRCSDGVVLAVQKLRLDDDEQLLLVSPRCTFSLAHHPWNRRYAVCAHAGRQQERVHHTPRQALGDAGRRAQRRR